MKEKVAYIEFNLLGNFVFACQKSWFSDEIDIEVKTVELAIQYNVSPLLISLREIVVELPIKFPKDYMKNLVGEFGISYESED